ncbi:hypothetical protein CHX26_14380 [Porphyrobacter sp. HT-58-2]|uniref:hypothetical protein n=1 Tax=Porphyrobacter sp. HT-58-2 TaxID=2023229 RepID=UPI000CDC3277|nr:hypothetical protein [Porphyrobacter sp. HT-58-2]AUX70527.1 hypothetical protein CHX26_14380 [Porphyrobacter sp. HT-58-2]
MKNIQRTLILGCSLVALAGCGADEIVSPGTSGDIIINNPPPAPAPTPTPTPTQSLVTPAAGCPTIATPGGLTDAGTLSGPTGEYRVCRLPARFTTTDTLPFIRGLVYQIPGRVEVGEDRGFASTGNAVTLTVQPGVILFGQQDSYLVVNRGNQIQSNGTADRPIIWTSRDNIQGLTDDNSQQQWGGVVLLGRAPHSDCSTGVFNTAANPNANPTCEGRLEGAAVATPFGGANRNDSSGSFRFNQIRFSGFELAPNNELQALTTGGAGSGTVIENLVSFNSSDDGVEFFGGVLNMRNFAIIGASDDSLDVDTGADVNLDTVIVVQRQTTGDRVIELDSPNVADRTPSNAIPQTRFQVNNFTFVVRDGAPQAVQARGGAALGLTNGVINAGNNHCFQLDEPTTLAALIGIDSVVGDCPTGNIARGGGGNTNEQALAAVNAGTNNNFAFTITLTNNVVNGTGEAGRTAFNANSRSTFFPTRSFIGAVENAAALASTFGNWTCNSSIQNFNSSTGACTSLPVYPV